VSGGVAAMTSKVRVNWAEEAALGFEQLDSANSSNGAKRLLEKREI